MSEPSYFARIGTLDLFGDHIDALASSDDSVRASAQEAINERMKELRVRIGTLLKTDNVSFLIGAGASIAAGGVSLATVPISFERELISRARTDKGTHAPWLQLFYRTASALSGQQFDVHGREQSIATVEPPPEPIPINLEEFLSHLHLWRASLGHFADDLALNASGKEVWTADRNDLDCLIEEANAVLMGLMQLPISGNKDALKDHRRLIKKILTRPLNLRRVNLFTLNYDTMIEQAADAEGAVVVDGFVGTVSRVFRPESYDLDFYFPAQTTEGRVHRFDRAVHLYKLHGSITWTRTDSDWDNPYGVYSVSSGAGNSPDVLIYPTPQKYAQALGMPYSELFRRFGSAVVQPQSVLFVVGYGFGDAHVNALIRQALAIPSFTLVVIDPRPTSEFAKQLAQLNDERIWLFHGWEIGTFEAFVEKVLPDLREEEIALKVMRTYSALKGPTAARGAGSHEGEA